MNNFEQHNLLYKAPSEPTYWITFDQGFTKFYFHGKYPNFIRRFFFRLLLGIKFNKL